MPHSLQERWLVQPKSRVYKTIALYGTNTVIHLSPMFHLPQLSICSHLEQKLKEAFAQRARAFNLQPRSMFAVSQEDYDDDDDE